MEGRDWHRIRNRVVSPILEIRKLKRNIFITRMLLILAVGYIIALHVFIWWVVYG